MDHLDQPLLNQKLGRGALTPQNYNFSGADIDMRDNNEIKTTNDMIPGNLGGLFVRQLSDQQIADHIYHQESYVNLDTVMTDQVVQQHEGRDVNFGEVIQTSNSNLNQQVNNSLIDANQAYEDFSLHNDYPYQNDEFYSHFAKLSPNAQLSLKNYFGTVLQRCTSDDKFELYKYDKTSIVKEVMQSTPNYTLNELYCQPQQYYFNEDDQQNIWETLQKIDGKYVRQTNQAIELVLKKSISKDQDLVELPDFMLKTATYSAHEGKQSTQSTLLQQQQHFQQWNQTTNIQNATEDRRGFQKRHEEMKRVTTYQTNIYGNKNQVNINISGGLIGGDQIIVNLCNCNQKQANHSVEQETIASQTQNLNSLMMQSQLAQDSDSNKNLDYDFDSKDQKEYETLLLMLQFIQDFSNQVDTQLKNKLYANWLIQIMDKAIGSLFYENQKQKENKMRQIPTQQQSIDFSLQNISTQFLLNDRSADQFYHFYKKQFQKIMVPNKKVVLIKYVIVDFETQISQKLGFSKELQNLCNQAVIHLEQFTSEGAVSTQNLRNQAKQFQACYSMNIEAFLPTGQTQAFLSSLNQVAAIFDKSVNKQKQIKKY